MVESIKDGRLTHRKLHHFFYAPSWVVGRVKNIRGRLKWAGSREVQFTLRSPPVQWLEKNSGEQ